MSYTNELRQDEFSHGLILSFQEKKKEKREEEITEITRKLTESQCDRDIFTSTLSGILKKYDLRKPE